MLAESGVDDGDPRDGVPDPLRQGRTCPLGVADGFPVAAPEPDCGGKFLAYRLDLLPGSRGATDVVEALRFLQVLLQLRQSVAICHLGIGVEDCLCGPAIPRGESRS